MSDDARSATTRSRRIAIWLALLAAVCLVGTYVGLVPLPIPEAPAIGPSSPWVYLLGGRWLVPLAVAGGFVGMVVPILNPVLFGRYRDWQARKVRGREPHEPR